MNSMNYYWRANAANIGGMNWSNAWSFMTIIAAPAAPVLASPTNNAINLPVPLTLSWGSSALATSYEVEISSSTFAGTIFFDQTGAFSAVQ